MADLRKLTEKEKALYNAQKSAQAQKYQQQANATNGFGQGLLDFVAGGEKPRAVLGGLLDFVAGGEKPRAVLGGLLGEIKQLGNPEYMRQVNPMTTDEAIEIAMMGLTTSGKLSDLVKTKKLNVKELGPYLKDVPIHVNNHTGPPFINIDEYGNVILNTKSDMKTSAELNREASLLLRKYFSPLKENEYIRTSTIEDYNHIKNLTHRGSKNWASGQMEGGLSVEKYPYPVGDFSYKVTGKKIGQGSDGEPLLDLSSVKAVTKPINFDKFNKQYEDRLIKNLNKLGITESDYRALITSGRVTRDPLPIWNKDIIDNLPPK